MIKPSKITIIIRSSPSSSSAMSAYLFTKAALELGHSVFVFFKDNGVYTGSNLTTMPQDEVNLNQTWRELGNNNLLSLNLCSAACLNKGIKENINLNQNFNISTLAELIENINQNDQTLTF